MDTPIVVSLIVSIVVLIAGFRLARRLRRSLDQSTSERAVRPFRLTSEHLHRLPSPAWRVVLEIDHPSLPDIDQVVIGPGGVLAISTVLGDRPPLDTAVEDNPEGAQATAAAAITRGPIDELLRPKGMRCDQLVHVYWGTPDLDQPIALPVVYATVAVDGRRLDQWITALPSDVLTRAQVDLAWHAITTGIGRPDPLPR